MKRLLSATAAAVFASGVALAQSAAPAPSPNPPAATQPAPATGAPAASQPGNNAVNAPNQNTAAQPVSGANSFTEGQARSRFEQAGYTAVTELAKDSQGVWRARAMKDGKQVAVSLDFQGNIHAQ
ncbi:MAG: hypothetical protein JNK46_06970 [Methylobacteriaceae bacterium]|nr:hypothetical protein [Methylobacteriaceae bacterium]